MISLPAWLGQSMLQSILSPSHLLLVNLLYFQLLVHSQLAPPSYLLLDLVKHSFHGVTDTAGRLNCRGCESSPRLVSVAARLALLLQQQLRRKEKTTLVARSFLCCARLNSFVSFQIIRSEIVWNHSSVGINSDCYFADSPAQSDRHFKVLNFLH